MKLRPSFAFLIAVHLAAGAASAELSGKVVGISDGDTLTLLDAGKQQHRVRLLGIDAPESGQAHGKAARQQLAELTFQREVSAECLPAPDRWGRQLCKVIVDGRDANLAMVQAGYAWHFTRYAKNQGAFDRVRYAAAELKAKHDRLGLWRDEERQPPWEWRASHSSTER